MTVSRRRTLVPIVVVGVAMTNSPWQYDGERNQPESKLPTFSISIDSDQRNGNVLVWVSRESDWTVFDRSADLLAEAFRGHWSEHVFRTNSGAGWEHSVTALLNPPPEPLPLSGSVVSSPPGLDTTSLLPARLH
jgi:hypothetical protein